MSLGDPIEAYVEELRAKLSARFDAVTVRLVVEEVRSHLQESASELHGNGCPPDVAAELAIARFGPVERGPLISNLMEQLCAGDLAWGRIAWAVSLVGALGLSLQALLAPRGAELTTAEAAPALTALSLLFLFACARARALVPMRSIVCSIAIIVLGASLIDPEVAPGGARTRPEAQQRLARGPLFASHIGSDEAVPSGLGPGLLADLDASSAYGPPLSLGERSAAPAGVERGRLEARLPTTAGFSDPTGLPAVARWQGWIPEAGRLAAVWLMLVGILQACGAWLVGLARTERELQVRLHL